MVDGEEFDASLSAVSAFADTESFYKAASDMLNASEEQLTRSGEWLGLDIDPFRLPMAKNRQLEELNENAFSDWFAWVLEFACQNCCDPLSLCESMFCSDSPRGECGNVEAGELPDIIRELPIPHGHPGREGRVDLLIHFNRSKRTWHIEVKINDAEQADLGKHLGYTRYLNEVYPGCHHILLVTDHRQERYGEFIPLTWEKICIRIRSLVAGSEKRDLSGAMLLFFCALVEQQLLGLNAASIRQMEYLRTSLEYNNASGR